MEYVITFKNTNHAIKAEQILLRQKLNITVMPLPTQVRAGCGICLRTIDADIKYAINILSKNSIEEIEVFQKEWSDGKNNYLKIERSDVLWNES